MKKHKDVVVWSDVLDGIYTCIVWRTDDPHTGVLTVKLDDEAIHTEEVAISYGAPFGPDVADVVDWREKCATAVDAKEKTDG